MRAGFALCALALAAPAFSAPIPAPAPEPFSFNSIVNTVKNNLGNILTSFTPSDISSAFKSVKGKLGDIFKQVPKVLKEVPKAVEGIAPEIEAAAPEIAEVGEGVGTFIAADPEILLLAARRAVTAGEATLDDLD